MLYYLGISHLGIESVGCNRSGDPTTGLWKPYLRVVAKKTACTRAWPSTKYERKTLRSHREIIHAQRHQLEQRSRLLAGADIRR